MPSHGFCAQAWSVLANEPPIVDKVVPYGNLPYVCLCCGQSSGNVYRASAWTFPGDYPYKFLEVYLDTSKSKLGHFRGQCACGDFTGEEHESDEAFYCVAVTCGGAGTLSVQVKANQLGDFQATNSIHFGATEILMQKEQRGWLYLFNQVVDDVYGVLMTVQKRSRYWVPNDNWTFNKQAPGDNAASCNICFAPKSPTITQHLRLGLFPRALAWLSQVGGMISLFTMCFSFIFVKKNGSHWIARIYNERTLISAHMRREPQVESNLPLTTLGSSSPQTSALPTASE